MSQGLYHYTNYSGLNGIFGTKSLWVTNIAYLNDSQEYRYAVGLLLAELLELRQTLTDPIEVEVTHRFGEFFDKGSTPEVYVFSMSKAFNQLSQWRAYSGGSGVFFELDSDRLVEDSKGYGFELVECLYDLQKQKSIIKDFVETRFNAMRSARPELSVGNAEKYLANAMMKKTHQVTMKEFGKIASIFKDPAFHEEQEWRLIANINKPSEHKKARVGSSLLIPYFELKIGNAFTDDSGINYHKLPIKKIVCGPNQHPELARGGVVAAMSATNTYFISVSNSQIPLRTI